MFSVMDFFRRRKNEDGFLCREGGGVESRKRFSIPRGF